MTAARNVYWIREPAQVKALASPVRQEIVDGFQTLGPCPVRDVAHSLGRSPHSLYHHVRALLKVGLLVETERRLNGRRMESLYATPGKFMRIRYDLASTSFVGNMRRTAHAMLRLTARDFHRGLGHAEARIDGADRNLWIVRIKGRLGRREIVEVNRRMLEILDILGGSRGKRDGELHALTLALVPAAGRRSKDATQRNTRSRPRSTRASPARKHS